MTESRSRVAYCSFKCSFGIRYFVMSFQYFIICWFFLFLFFFFPGKMFYLFTLCLEKRDWKFKTALCNLWFLCIWLCSLYFWFFCGEFLICCAKEAFQIPFYLLKRIWCSFPIFSPPGHNSFIPKVCTYVQIERYFQRDATAVLLTVALNQFAEAVSFKLFI